MLAESSAFYVSYVALWALVLALSLLVLLVYRHFGMTALGSLEGVQRDGLAVGDDAREITGVEASGDPFVWAPSVPTFLLFAAPGCKPCSDVLPTVNDLANAAPSLNLNVLTVVAGAMDSAREMKTKYRLGFPVVAEDGSQTFDVYRVRVTPFGFVIGEDGRVRAKGLCSNASRLHDLLESGGMEDAARVIARELASDNVPLAAVGPGIS
jgi:peroxiredoxin